MLQKEQLEIMKVEELRNLCKENGIGIYKGKNRLTKSELVQKLIGLGENDSKKVEHKKPEDLEKEPVPPEKVAKLEEERKERKRKYVENATIGTIVAFTLPGGKTISSAIVKKSTKGRKFLVETKYGSEHKISFDDVIWVKTSKRWPKGVYKLFKKNQPEVRECQKTGRLDNI